VHPPCCVSQCQSHAPGAGHCGWGGRAGSLNYSPGSSGGFGWSDSPQWVERFAPVSGAIRTSTRNQGPRRSREESVVVASILQRLRYDASPTDAFGTAFAHGNRIDPAPSVRTGGGPRGPRGRGAEPCRDHWASVAATPGGRCSQFDSEFWFPLSSGFEAAEEVFSCRVFSD